MPNPSLSYNVPIASPVVVCVGLGRTGTTSFGDAMEQLGFSRLGWTEQSDELMSLWRNGDSRTLMRVAGQFDVLEDLPWPMLYRDLARTYPKTKFVLTRRSSTKIWLASQIAHTRTRPDYWGHEAVYGATLAEESPSRYCSAYERHLAEVRTFFEGSGKLAEFCWEEGDGWEQLCSFLGIAVPTHEPFPHANQRLV